MSVPCRSVAVAVAVASLWLAGPAVAARNPPLVRVHPGERVTVRVPQLLVYDDLGGSYSGSLSRGETFRVLRVSASGHFAYGVAYGHYNRPGWIRTDRLVTLVL